MTNTVSRVVGGRNSAQFGCFKVAMSSTCPVCAEQIVGDENTHIDTCLSQYALREEAAEAEARDRARQEAAEVQQQAKRARAETVVVYAVEEAAAAAEAADAAEAETTGTENVAPMADTFNLDVVDTVDGKRRVFDGMCAELAQVMPDEIRALQRLFHETIDEVTCAAMIREDQVHERSSKARRQLEDEFSQIRLELEHARTMLDEKQRDELSLIRAEEMKKHEEAVEVEKKRLEAEAEEQRQQMRQGTLLLPGEKEALQGEHTVYFKLLPTVGDDLSPASLRFRQVESQFYRLSLGTNHKVRMVEYVVNPRLHQAFHAARSLLVAAGSEAALPVLAFHGTAEENITPICENGFRDPKAPDFRVANGSAYGKGVYFARDSSYSVAYAGTSGKMLMAYLLVKPEDKQPPGTKMIVMQDSDRCLPAYIVHFGNDVREEARPIVAEASYERDTQGQPTAPGAVRRVIAPKRATNAHARRQTPAAPVPVVPAAVAAQPVPTVTVPMYQRLTGVFNMFNRNAPDVGVNMDEGQ